MGTSEQAVITAEGTERPSRRRRAVAEKRRIVEETLAAGASVASVARAHGVNANLVFNWRRLYQRGLLGGSAPAAALIPVTLSEAPAGRDAMPTALPGTIQLRLPKGQLRVEGAADPACLRVVLEYLLG